MRSNIADGPAPAYVVKALYRFQMSSANRSLQRKPVRDEAKRSVSDYDSRAVSVGKSDYDSRAVSVGKSDYYGPGYWDVIHRMAASLCGVSGLTLAQVNETVDACLAIMKRFPCSVCRGHIEEYLEANPIDKKCLTKYGMDCSFFRWTWRYHNVVNHRKGKPLMTYDEAYAQYNEKIVACPNP